MEAQQAGLLSSFVYVATKLLKEGFGFKGRIVLIIVTLISIGFAVSFMLARGPVTPEALLDSMTQALTIALAALGLDNLVTYKPSPPAPPPGQPDALLPPPTAPTGPPTGPPPPTTPPYA